MRVTLCDRCGDRIPEGGVFGVRMYETSGDGFGDSSDLCRACFVDIQGALRCSPPGSRREKEVSLGMLRPWPGDTSTVLREVADETADGVTPTLMPTPPLSPKAEAAHAEIIARGKEKARKPKGVPKGEPIPLYVYPGEVEGVCSRAACGMGGVLVADGCKYEVVVGDKRATFTATNVGDVPHMHQRAAAFVAASGIPADEWRRDGDLTYSVPVKTFRAKYPEV